jgi:Na+/alanine symporter
MLAAMATVSGSGFLIDQVCRRGVTFWGMGRRTWIDIHLWSGIVIVVLLVLHIVLHWKMVDGFFRKVIPNYALRYAVYALLLALVLITVVPWAFM